MALDGITLFLRSKDIKITGKQMQRSLSIGEKSSVQCCVFTLERHYYYRYECDIFYVLAGVLKCNDGKMEEAKDFKCIFVVYCVRIKIDQH